MESYIVRFLLCFGIIVFFLRYYFPELIFDRSKGNTHNRKVFVLHLLGLLSAAFLQDVLLYFYSLF